MTGRSCSTTRTTRASPAPRPGCWRRSTPPACSSPPTCTSPHGSRGSAAKPRTTSCSRWRWPSAGCGSGRSASTWPRSGARCWARVTSSSTSPVCRGPTPAAWVAACAASPLVADGRPRRTGGRCGWSTGCSTWSGTGGRRSWSARSWPPAPTPCAPTRAKPSTSTGCAPALARLFGDVGDPREHQQRLAAAVAALRPVTVLAGGPGTGKTTTVAKILALLRDRPGAPPRIALAAPTGKAAARLQEAVREAGVDDLPDRLDPAPAAGLAAGPQPVPPRPVRPAALRRDRRGRDVDGVADDDGPAARRRAPGRPAGAGRRPGPAGVGRGRRGPRRPRPRPRPSRTTPRRRPRGAGAARPASSTGW